MAHVFALLILYSCLSPLSWYSLMGRLIVKVAASLSEHRWVSDMSSKGLQSISNTSCLVLFFPPGCHISPFFRVFCLLWLKWSFSGGSMSIVNVISHDGKGFSKTSLPVILKRVYSYISNTKQKRPWVKDWAPFEVPKLLPTQASCVSAFHTLQVSSWGTTGQKHI